MKVAYLLNSYPMTSTTFIRREIEALEALGFEVARYAARVWPHPLVDARDERERDRTHYVLTGNRRKLFAAFLFECAKNLSGVLRAAKGARGIARDMGELTRPIAYLLQAAYFAQQAARSAIEHVHVHFTSNAASVAMLSRLMGGPTYSFTAHGPDELVDLPRLSLAAKAREASFVVAISDYCRARLVEHCRPEDAHKIRVVRCGLALEEFAAAPEPPPDVQTFVCIGRLCPQKGQELIPAAVAALRDEFPELEVVLVGDGESRPAIEDAITRHGVERHVSLRGWASNAEALALLNASRALLLPSFAEGLPIVIMEALCLGRPVVSTSVAGIPELVDDACGWLVRPGDHDALVGAMRAALLASPGALNAMGKVGRERVMHRHDRRDLARSLHDLIHRPPGIVARSDGAPSPAGPLAELRSLS